MMGEVVSLCMLEEERGEKVASGPRTPLVGPGTPRFSGENAAKGTPRVGPGTTRFSGEKMVSDCNKDKCVPAMGTVNNDRLNKLKSHIKQNYRYPHKI